MDPDLGREVSLLRIQRDELLSKLGDVSLREQLNAQALRSQKEQFLREILILKEQVISRERLGAAYHPDFNGLTALDMNGQPAVLESDPAVDVDRQKKLAKEQHAILERSRANLREKEHQLALAEQTIQALQVQCQEIESELRRSQAREEEAKQLLAADRSAELEGLLDQERQQNTLLTARLATQSEENESLAATVEQLKEQLVEERERRAAAQRGREVAEEQVLLLKRNAAQVTHTQETPSRASSTVEIMQLRQQLDALQRENQTLRLQSQHSAASESLPNVFSTTAPRPEVRAERAHKQTQTEREQEPERPASASYVFHDPVPDSSVLLSMELAELKAAAASAQAQARRLELQKQKIESELNRAQQRITQLETLVSQHTGDDTQTHQLDVSLPRLIAESDGQPSARQEAAPPRPERAAAPAAVPVRQQEARPASRGSEPGSRPQSSHLQSRPQPVPHAPPPQADTRQPQRVPQAPQRGQMRPQQAAQRPPSAQPVTAAPPRQQAPVAPPQDTRVPPQRQTDAPPRTPDLTRLPSLDPRRPATPQSQSERPQSRSSRPASRSQLYSRESSELPGHVLHRADSRQPMPPDVVQSLMAQRQAYTRNEQGAFGAFLSAEDLESPADGEPQQFDDTQGVRTDTIGSFGLSSLTLLSSSAGPAVLPSTMAPQAATLAASELQMLIADPTLRAPYGLFDGSVSRVKPQLEQVHPEMELPEYVPPEYLYASRLETPPGQYVGAESIRSFTAETQRSPRRAGLSPPRTAPPLRQVRDTMSAQDYANEVLLETISLAASGVPGAIASGQGSSLRELPPDIDESVVKVNMQPCFPNIERVSEQLLRSDLPPSCSLSSSSVQAARIAMASARLQQMKDAESDDVFLQGGPNAFAPSAILSSGSSNILVSAFRRGELVAKRTGGQK